MKLEDSLKAEYARAAGALDAMSELHRAWAAFQPPPPLNRSEMMTLGTVHGLLRQGRAVTASALARAMHQSLPGISQKLSGLQAMGYVCRTPNPADRRAHCISLTPAGRQLAERSLRDFLHKVEQALDILGPEKADNLTELLRMLCTAITQVQTQSEGADETC